MSSTFTWFYSQCEVNLLKVRKKTKQMQIPSSGWSRRNKTGRHAANAQLGELRTVILFFISQRTVLVSPSVHMYLSLLLITAVLLCMMGKPQWHHQPKQPSGEFSVCYITTFSANVFPSPILAINSFLHEPKPPRVSVRHYCELHYYYYHLLYIKILAFPSPFSGVILEKGE